MNNLRCLRAIDRRDLTVIESLIAKDDQPFDQSVGTCKMPPVIFYAVQCRFLEAVKLLVATKCNVNVKYTADLKTPLHLACSNSDLEIVEELLNNGHMVNVNEVDAEGETALFDAVESSAFTKQTAVIECLLKHGAVINIVAKSESTPLNRAIETDALATVQLLLNSGAKVDVVNLKELKSALRRNNNDMIELLLKFYKEKLKLHEVDLPESPVDLCLQNSNLPSMKLAIELGFTATKRLFDDPMVLFKTMVSSVHANFSSAKFCFDYLMTFRSFINLNHRFAFSLQLPTQTKVITGNILTYSLTFNCSHMTIQLIKIGAPIETTALDNYRFNAYDLPALKLLYYNGFQFAKNFETKCQPSSCLTVNREIHVNAFRMFCEWINLKNLMPRELKESSRIVIRKQMSSRIVCADELKLPESLEKYLRFDGERVV